MNKIAAILSEDNSAIERPGPVSGRVGVLLLNLGTPDAPDAASVRRYLKEFLSDKRVIEKDSLGWRLILNGFILRFRPRRKARDYAKIWNRELDESPLKTITRSQADILSGLLASKGVIVQWGMRYGNPSAGAALRSLAEAGCDRILLVPLYPQYASATTATAADQAFRVLMRMRAQPAIRIVPPYYKDPVYIDALVSSLRDELSKLAFEPEVILASFHGIPREYAAKGDPYPRQCEETIRLMREKLGFGEDKLRLTYQSRFGRDQWLQPYTDKTVKELARTGVKKLAIITPGFSSDCLETLEEIAVENAHIFKRNKGENFVAIPCLNDSPDGMRVIEHIVRRELQGWI
jgi:protoporphyrin/coproporphyrin ferrochelatase